MNTPNDRRERSHARRAQRHLEPRRIIPPSSELPLLPEKPPKESIDLRDTIRNTEKLSLKNQLLRDVLAIYLVTKVPVEWRSARYLLGQLHQTSRWKNLTCSHFCERMRGMGVPTSRHPWFGTMHSGYSFESLTRAWMKRVLTVRPGSPGTLKKEKTNEHDCNKSK